MTATPRSDDEFAFRAPAPSLARIDAAPPPFPGAPWLWTLSDESGRLIRLQAGAPDRSPAARTRLETVFGCLAFSDPSENLAEYLSESIEAGDFAAASAALLAGAEPSGFDGSEPAAYLRALDRARLDPDSASFFLGLLAAFGLDPRRSLPYPEWTCAQAATALAEPEILGWAFDAGWADPVDLRGALGERRGSRKMQNLILSRNLSAVRLAKACSALDPTFVRCSFGLDLDAFEAEVRFLLFMGHHAALACALPELRSEAAEALVQDAFFKWAFDKRSSLSDSRRFSLFHQARLWAELPVHAPSPRAVAAALVARVLEGDDPGIDPDAESAARLAPWLAPLGSAPVQAAVRMKAARKPDPLRAGRHGVELLLLAGANPLDEGFAFCSLAPAAAARLAVHREEAEILAELAVAPSDCSALVSAL